MDEARAMLDQLMGKTRNLSENQKDKVQKIHFNNEKVCKYYVCGLCPFISFHGTKSDIGKCPFQICGKIIYSLLLLFFLFVLYFFLSFFLILLFVLDLFSFFS